MEWVFPQMEYMSTMFPVLLKRSWLLPLCWFLRILRMSGQQVNLWILQKSQDMSRIWHGFYGPKKERALRWYSPKAERVGAWYSQVKESIGKWYKEKAKVIERMKINLKRKGVGAGNIRQNLKKLFRKK